VTFVIDTVYLNGSNIHYTSVTKSRQKTTTISMKPGDIIFVNSPVIAVAKPDLIGSAIYF
jgi:N-methylhydantoinase B/oxoprolinase/acetone carboxylase alpha subunit